MSGRWIEECQCGSRKIAICPWYATILGWFIFGIGFIGGDIICSLSH